MESINSIFLKNAFASYPTNYNAKQKTMLSLGSGNIFQNDKCINDEISECIDILYSNKNENGLNPTDILKMNTAYNPMKNQKLHYGTFYI